MPQGTSSALVPPPAAASARATPASSRRWLRVGRPPALVLA
ncbi:MAG: hypothetical protein M5U09_10605 [Gammaproteobacteria bacterium]|nr:hypothetical protein [Gammaproteobacteria bacterium]